MSPPAPPPSRDGWTEQGNVNYVSGGNIDGRTFVLLGKFANATACLSACKAAASCHAYTWHDGDQAGWANKCVGRTDGMYTATAQQGHHSGHDSEARLANIWVANVKGQTKGRVQGLQIDGVRATRAYD
eukprot:gene8863-21571_t